MIKLLASNSEFNFTKDDLSTKEKLIHTYHRIIEAFKFANAYRPHFSDPDFPLHKKEFEKVRALLLYVSEIRFGECSDSKTSANYLLNFNLHVMGSASTFVWLHFLKISLFFTKFPCRNKVFP